MRACSVCGSQRLRMPGFADGIVPEIDNLQEWVCEKGHQMTPLEFDDAEALRAFQDSLA
ncbi:MAG: hypothetical protein ACPHID_05560 [Thermoplasmatota archaeon]